MSGQNRIAGTRTNVYELRAADHAEGRHRSHAGANEDWVKRDHQQQCKTGMRRHEDHHDLRHQERGAEKNIGGLDQLQRLFKN